MIAAGDPISLLACDRSQVAVAEVTRIYAFEQDDVAAIHNAVAVPVLAEDWRTYFVGRLAAAGAE